MQIAIEGMDGVGKTTIAKKLAEDFDFMYIDKPLHYLLLGTELETYTQLNSILRKMYDLDDPVIKSWMIGLGNLYSSRQFKDKNVVLDRHLVSNYFWNGEQESNLVFKTMIELMGIPDMTILLYASPQTRKKRLYLRDKNDRDLSDPEIWVEGYDKMKKFLEDFSIPYIPINTENRDIEEVYEIVRKKVEKYIEKEKNKDGTIESCR